MVKGDIMSPDHVRAWRDRNRLTQAAAAHAVGRTVKTIQRYESGAEPVPLTVRLAMLAVELGYADFEGERGRLRET